MSTAKNREWGWHEPVAIASFLAAVSALIFGTSIYLAERAVVGADAEKLEAFARLGDATAGFIGSSASAAAFFVIFSATILQMKELALQRQELADTREAHRANVVENANQARALEEQIRILKEQHAFSRFLSLLDQTWASEGRLSDRTLEKGKRNARSFIERAAGAAGDSQVNYVLNYYQELRAHIGFLELMLRQYENDDRVLKQILSVYPLDHLGNIHKVVQSCEKTSGRIRFNAEEFCRIVRDLQAKQAAPVLV